MLNVTVIETETPVQPAQQQQANGYTLSRNLLPLAIPSQFILPPAAVVATVSITASTNAALTTTGSTPKLARSIVTVTSNATALFVWLSTRANGRFEDNAFTMAGESSREIQFIPFGTEPLDTTLLTKSLRVEHLQQHLNTYN
jgi:hypothetical protein